MRPHFYPLQRSATTPCPNYIAMATSIHHHYFPVPSSPTNHRFLPKPQISPHLKTFTFPPDKPLSFKQICNQGNLKEAFESFNSLLFAGENNPTIVYCSDEVYSSILELCASKKALLQGQQIHGHLVKSTRLLDSAFLGTKIVFMYGKCGSVLNAEKVFDGMSQRSVFTWNAIIGAHVTNGDCWGAMELYREMRIFGENLDAYTFPSVLKACGGVKDMRCGEEVHGLAIKFGFDSTVFVVNSLVSMYAKCDNLIVARKLFDRIVDKDDVVSWNSMISAYSSNGLSVEALTIFREMQKASLVTNTYTYVAALQACEKSSLNKLGMEIHAALLKTNQLLDVHVANALIAMYARCGRMSEAAGIFTYMDNKDGISWNSMISGLVQNGMYSDALLLIRNMLNKRKNIDQVSVIGALASSGRLGHLLNGKEIHAYAIKKGLNNDLQVGNTLIDMYSKCISVNYMNRVFREMHIKDFISWTTIISGYAQNDFYLRALELFREVQREGMEVDALMIGSIIMACNGLKCTSIIKEVHGYILRRELLDHVLQNSIVDAYGQCGNIDYAVQMFNLIELKDVVSWTSIISCYAQNGLHGESLSFFHLMTAARTDADYISLVTVLSATAGLSALNKGKEIHGFIIRKGFTLEGPIANAVVDMYAHCGALQDSFKVFTGTTNKSLVIWTTMINAYGMHGYGKKAIELFDKMEDEGIVPDHITFLALLNACSHSGLVDEGKSYLKIMKHDYQLEPWPEHYACLVDLLGRTNHLEEAYSFVKSMHIEPTTEIWCALLGACRVHSNKELGEIASQKLLELKPENPGNYVLISNIFASNGKWDDVKVLRARMKEFNIEKNPGYSWIEIGNKVHKFMSRDRSHIESDKIYQKLAQITVKLENEGGYVAQTRFVLHDVSEEEKVKMLYGHSERLALAYGFLKTFEGAPIRITKNLRFCGDCHTFVKLVSKLFGRDFVVRDANRFHHFTNGACSCGDFW